MNSLAVRLSLSVRPFRLPNRPTMLHRRGEGGSNSRATRTQPTQDTFYVPIANLSSSQPLLNSKGLKRLQIRLEIHLKSHGGCGMFAIEVITFKQLNGQQWESVYFPIINAEKWANASAAFPSHKPFTNEEVKHRRISSFFSSLHKHTQIELAIGRHGCVGCSSAFAFLVFFQIEAKR